VDDNIERVIDIEPVLFSCPECHCASQIDKRYILTRESVQQDFNHAVYVGNAFIQCPICEHKEYLSIRRPSISEED